MVFEKLLIFMEEMKRKEKEDDGIKRAIIKSKKEPSINLLADLRSKKINFFTLKNLLNSIFPAFLKMCILRILRRRKNINKYE